MRISSGSLTGHHKELENLNRTKLSCRVNWNKNKRSKHRVKINSKFKQDFALLWRKIETKMICRTSYKIQVSVKIEK